MIRHTNEKIKSISHFYVYFICSQYYLRQTSDKKGYVLLNFNAFLLEFNFYECIVLCKAGINFGKLTLIHRRLNYSLSID